MKKTILLTTLFLTSSLMAGKLTVIKGNIQAHTEVFGDSTINPATNNIISHLKMGKSITSIEGYVQVGISKLKSDNSDRDEHMFKVLEVTKYPNSKYTFTKVTKNKNGYIINGILNFHGVAKPLTVKADIYENKKSITIKGSSSFLLSKYKIKPIKLLFLTVRDKIDLAINITFKKR